MAGIAPILSDGHWWIAVLAVAILGCLLIGAVCWMAQRTDADEISTPILSWRRSKPPRPPES